MLSKANKTNNYHYNKKLQPLAKANKKNLTKSAAALWIFALKAEQMIGYSFRRERPILDYIADFVSLELMLIIEVDGITHQNKMQQKKDQKRDKVLAVIGFTTLRFSSWEVLNEIEKVRYKIEQWIESKKQIQKQTNN